MSLLKQTKITSGTWYAAAVLANAFSVFPPQSFSGRKMGRNHIDLEGQQYTFMFLPPGYRDLLTLSPRSTSHPSEPLTGFEGTSSEGHHYDGILSIRPRREEVPSALDAMSSRTYAQEAGI